MSKTATEAEGIKAIQYLQKMANIDEPVARARAGWRAMSDHQKEHTMKCYEMFQPVATAKRDQNSIRVIEPYRWNSAWVFDDPSVNLRREPFVGGADDLCEAMATVRGVVYDRFTLLFSDEEFPNYQLHLKLKRVEKVGQTYITDDRKEAWLCPALLKYFIGPPQHIYAMAKHQVKYAAKRPSHPWQRYHQFSPARRA